MTRGPGTSALTNKQLREEMKAKDNTITQLKEELSKTKQVLKNANKAIEGLQAVIKDRNDEITYLEDKVDTHVKNTAQLHRQVNSANREYDNVSAQLVTQVMRANESEEKLSDRLDYEQTIREAAYDEYAARLELQTEFNEFKARHAHCGF